MILDKVNSPLDVKSLTKAEMEELAIEMQGLITKKVNVTGGHMGPNLGIIETTIALHNVFESPKDKIVFDVSHQCYPHKILSKLPTLFSTNEAKLCKLEKGKHACTVIYMILDYQDSSIHTPC